MPHSDSITLLLTSFSHGRLAVRSELCSRVRHRAGTCTLCMQACAHDAIGIQDGCGPVDIDPACCSFCGNCAAACPTGAIEALDPSAEELLESALGCIGEDGSVLLCCERSMPRRGWDRSRIVSVPCIGRIDESVLVGLAVAGASRTCIFAGGCQGCEEAAGYDLACLAADSACCLLSSFGCDMPVEMLDEIPDEYRGQQSRKLLGSVQGMSSACSNQKTPCAPSEQGASRRDFFQHAGSQAKAIAATRISSSPLGVLGTRGDAQPDDGRTPSVLELLQVADDGRMLQLPEPRRERVLSCLGLLGEPSCELAITSLFGSVSIDADACTGCGMCATFCPTGALAHAMREGRRLVAFRARRCTCCRLCEQVCPQGAIYASEEASLPAMLANKAEIMAVEQNSAADGQFGAFTIVPETRAVDAKTGVAG